MKAGWGYIENRTEARQGGKGGRGCREEVGGWGWGEGGRDLRSTEKRFLDVSRKSGMRKRKSHVYEDEECVEAIHHVDEGAAQAAGSNLTYQEGKSQDQHASVH